MNAKMILSIALLLSFFPTYANDLGLTEDQLNSILTTETASPAIKEVLTPQEEKIKKAPIAVLDKKRLTRYVEDSIRNIKPVITGGYLGNLETEEKSAYPKALKEIKSDCASLSVRASDMKKNKMSSGALKKLKGSVFKSCYTKVLKAFKQDIPKVKAYLKREQQL